MMFYKDDRVRTIRGMGTVSYVRMSPPFYDQIASVSVILDSEKNVSGYTGTILNIKEIYGVCGND